MPTVMGGFGLVVIDNPDLEEDSFAVATGGAPDGHGGAGQGRVSGDVLEHLGERPGRCGGPRYEAAGN
uniref:Uncharacterized protein n=1 Tax=Oryza barthii TaxID=65489 RepID=A0A679BBE9_9ORYZ|nr:hypothetical protein [Oryza barthii]